MVTINRIFAFVCLKHEHLVADMQIIFLADRLHNLRVLKQIMFHIHQCRCTVNHNFKRQIAAGGKGSKMLHGHFR
ncbi:hypothetical protein D3C85_1589640 [compost metagenome]